MSQTPGAGPRPARHLSRRGLLGAGVALLAGAGGGTAWALDRFVVEHAETTAASTLWEPEAPASGTVTQNAYEGTNARITIETSSAGSGSEKVTWFVAHLLLADASALRTAFAEDTYGENIIDLPSAIAAEHGAVFAVNGDYYGFRDTGIVIRNGVAFRDRGARGGLVLGSDGALRLYDETATDAARLLADGAWQTWSFGPGLVEDGVVVTGIDEVEVDTNVGNHSIQGRQPRTGIGMVEPGHLLAVVVDGRSTGYSRGVTLTEFARIFADLGARVAYNLDGGGSSTMVFDNRLVNDPLGRGTERGTSDIWYVAG